jgi:oligopeptide transport system permease protein
MSGPETATDRREGAFEAVHRRRATFEETLSRTAEARGREAGAALPRASLWKDAYYRFIKNKASVVAAIAFLVLLGYVLIVPFLAEHHIIWKNNDPYAVRFDQAFLSPSWAHPFGTDEFGRDLWVRTALGGRVSFAIGLAATAAIMIVGITYGSISGFSGGKLDNAMMRFLDALYGLPYLPFAIITLAILGTVNFWSMVIALTIASWFTTARVMRGQIITLKQNDYVRAAYAAGARRHRVLFRHLLVNTLGVIIVFVFLELPGVILGEAFLSFIGLGINPPKASWGTLAQDGYQYYQAHPYIIVIPSIMIAWLILSAFFIADGLRDALDPRSREV